MEPQIAMAVPQQIGAQRFLRSIMTAITKVPDLALCTQGSFFICVLSTAQLGLMPNVPGGVWLIPRKNKGGFRECTMIVDYRGLCALARRSGVVSSIRGVCVHDGDHFEWEEGTSPRLVHRPDMTDLNRHEKPVSWVYGTAKIQGDEVPHFAVLSHAQVEKRRRVNSGTTSSYSPWVNWWHEMAQKTAVRQALKLAPMDTEDQLSRALALESAAEGGRLTEVVDAKVADAIQASGIKLIESAPEPSSPGDPDPKTAGLTPEEVAAGYEMTGDGEIIPPPPAGGAK
jgi:recombination protein RecT